jgi:hypothetical protein
MGLFKGVSLNDSEEMRKEKETFWPITVLGPVTNSMFTRWRRRRTTLRILATEKAKLSHIGKSGKRENKEKEKKKKEQTNQENKRKREKNMA